MRPTDSRGFETMRALVIAHSSVSGGAERYLVRLYSHFASIGVRVEIGGMVPGWNPDLGRANDLRLSGKWSKRTLPGGLLQVSAETHRVVDLAKAFEPDWIHLQFKREQIGFTKALSAIAPVIWTEHGVYPAGMAPLRIPYARAARHASAVICVSTAVSDSITPLVGKTPMAVIENAVDDRLHAVADETRQRHLRESAGLSPDQFVVLWIGRLDKGKRPELALRYARANPDHQVIVLGAGAEGIRLAQASIGVPNYRMLGHVDDPSPYYDIANVLMFTSRSEGMPTTIVEAAAHDRPVVTHVGSSVETMARDAGGLVVTDCSDMRAWRECFLRPRDSQRDAMRSEWRRQHSYRGWVDAHRAVIESALRRPGLLSS